MTCLCMLSWAKKWINVMSRGTVIGEDYSLPSPQCIALVSGSAVYHLSGLHVIAAFLCFQFITQLLELHL